MRPFAVALIAACNAQHAAPQNVTIPPPTASASARIEAPYASTARSALDAAEALERAGRTNEARTAYEEIIRKYPSSLSADQARGRVARLLMHAIVSVGDVTCQTDTDCTVTTKRECCECCPRKALATSKKWLEWRDTQQCGPTQCVACEESCPPETGKAAFCNAGKCELTKK